MRDRLRELQARLEALSVRERALVLGVTLALLFLLWDVALLQPFQTRGALLLENRERLEEQSRLLGARGTELERALATDPHRDMRAAIEELGAEIVEVDDELRERTSELIPPRRMAELLEQLLASEPALRVAHLEALPSEPLLEPDGDAETDAATQDPGPGFYRHGMQIELEGTFHDTVAFLHEVESLPGSFVWDRIHYQVSDWPNARVTLVVFMLGSAEGWIGV